MVRYNYQYRHRNCIIVTLIYLIGWIDGAAGCDHDHHRHLEGEDHHRHLDEEAAAAIEPCGFEEPSPVERLQDQINMFLWRFDRNTDPDAPPINYTIPVYFHIFQQNSTELLVDDSNVALYMNYLSSSFIASGAPFRFTFMGITRTINATISNSCFAYQNDIKPILKRGGKETLNVYVCNRINDKAWVGYASLPSNNPGTNDGVTISRTTPTDLNRPNTLVHEVGHYLGLHHTFVDNCTTTRGGDLVDDTPYHVSLSSAVNCRTPVSTWDTCPTLPGLDPVDNFMTYTVANHECRTKFTPGQVDRMKAQFEIYRYVAPPIPPPTKAPTVRPTTAPTRAPTRKPTKAPTRKPTKAPTRKPTTEPTRKPTTAPTRVPITAPTAAPASVLTPAPKATSAAVPTLAPTKAPTILTQVPLQSTTGKPIQISTPATAPTLPIATPATSVPAVTPVVTVTKTPATTTSPATNSPLTLTPPTTTTLVPAPNTAPIPSSPALSSDFPSTTAPVVPGTSAPVPVIFTAAPIAPKCKFYFSLCDTNDECCGGVCRKFLGLFPERCSIFIFRTV